MAFDKVEAYYRTRVESWTPTSEETGFEADNMLDGLDTTWWRATSSADQEIVYDNGNSKVSEFPTSDYDASSTAPTGIDYAPNGTLWICDQTSNKIYNVQTDGTLISSFLSSVFDASATLMEGIAYDYTNGTLWVTDQQTDKIYNIKTDGTLISSFSSPGNTPTGVAVDKDGTLWHTDAATDKIYNLERDGTVISFVDAPDSISTGISISSDGTLWISGDSSNAIFNVNKDGSINYSFSTTTFVDAGAISPTDVAEDASGYLWLSDAVADDIYEVNPPIAFDYLAIGAGHNLNTIGAQVEFYYSNDAAAYTQIGETYTPINDKSFIIKPSSILVHRAIKVKIINASAAANITSMLVGEKTILGYARLYDPHRRKRRQIINITEGGRLAGASIKYTMREVDLKFRQVDNDFYDRLDALWQNNGLKIFFLAWEPGTHPSEVWPVYISRDERNSPFVKSGVLRNDNLRLQGLYE